jgi:hypothetical protein
VLNVRVTEVVDGSRFYAQIESDPRLQSLEQQLEALKLKEKVLPPGAFAPKRGDLVLGQFTLDDSFARALVVEAPKQQTGSGSDKYEVGARGSGLFLVRGVGRMHPLRRHTMDQSAGICTLGSLKFVVRGNMYVAKIPKTSTIEDSPRRGQERTAWPFQRQVCSSARARRTRRPLPSWDASARRP